MGKSSKIFLEIQEEQEKDTCRYRYMEEMWNYYSNGEDEVQTE